MDEQQTPAVTPAKQSESKGVRTLFDYVEMFVLSAAFVLLLLTFCFRVCVVEGPSMNQTLINGEKLIVSDLFYTPKQGDIIVFHHTSDTYTEYNEPIVKRVIATGGQFVKINYKENKVYVSSDKSFEENEIIDERSYAYLSNGVWKESLFGEESEVFEIPENHLFVLGDNRNNSADSRAYYIGFVDERCVLGKVVFRFSPLSAFGAVK